MGFENPIVGGTALRIPAIQSPNYSPGVAGWIIKINGDAEFNNLTIRGEFVGNDFIINSDGIFLYSGTPAAGNLIGSWASAAGTDAFTNAYQAGLTIYGASTAINLFDNDVTLTASNGTTAVLESGTNAALYLKPAAASGPWFAGGLDSGIGGGSHPLINLSSPADTTNGVQSVISMQGSSTASVLTAILSVADRWTHNGDLFANNIQSGSFTVTPTVASQWTANVVVTFPAAFTATPVVMVTPSAGGPGTGSTTELEFQTTGVTTTGFNCRVRRDNLTAVTMSYLAVLA